MSEQPHKVPGTPSVGEMTTTDVSNKPSSEDNRTALPKKPRLAVGVAYTVSRDASQAQLTPTVLQSTDKSKESLPEKVDTSGTDGHKAGSEEPMELGAGSWRRPAGPTEQQTEAGTSAEPLQKVEVGRTSELSLEDLSISSRQQQQLQASATTKVTLPTSGTDQGTLRRPNRKRKLLEDVESGKTLLLDAYRVWQHGQKVMTYDLGRVEKIMSETYMLIKQVKRFVSSPGFGFASHACRRGKHSKNLRPVTACLIKRLLLRCSGTSCSTSPPWLQQMNQSGQILLIREPFLTPPPSLP